MLLDIISSFPNLSFSISEMEMMQTPVLTVTAMTVCNRKPLEFFKQGMYIRKTYREAMQKTNWKYKQLEERIPLAPMRMSCRTESRPRKRRELSESRINRLTRQGVGKTVKDNRGFKLMCIKVLKNRQLQDSGPPFRKEKSYS